MGVRSGPVQPTLPSALLKQGRSSPATNNDASPCDNFTLAIRYLRLFICAVAPMPFRPYHEC